MAAAVVLAVAVSTFNGAAAAPQYPGSQACSNLNGTSTGVTQITDLPGSVRPVTFGLQPGDRVTVTVDSLSTAGSVRVYAAGTDAVPPVITISFGTFSTASGSFTYTTANDLSLQASQPLSATYRFACEGSAPVAPTGPTNSEILDQTKQTYSKVGAQASVTAMSDATSGAIGDAFSGGGATQFGQGGFSTNFVAIERARENEDNVAADGDPLNALAYKKTRIAHTKAPFKKAPLKLQSQWHVWIEGRYTGFEDKSGARFDGWHSNLTGGASYRFTQNFVAGVVLGYENFKYSVPVAGVATSLDGRGVSGGGYFGWKFYDRMRLDGMLTYGRIDYTGTAGAVTGSFGADRITGMGKLSGRYNMGKFYLEPSSTLVVASERQDSFIDSAAIFHDKFNFTVGRSSSGATVGVPMAWGMMVVTPTFGAFADYRFGDQTTAAANVVPTFNNGWSAHVNGGLSVAMPNNLTASATGEYGGLGDTIRYWRAKGSLGVKF